MSSWNCKTSSLQHDISALQVESTRKDDELQAKTKSLTEKDSIIAQMSQQLATTRDNLSSKELVTYF